MNKSTAIQRKPENVIQAIVVNILVQF